MALVVFITMAMMGALGTVDVYHDSLTKLVTHAVVTNNTGAPVRLTIQQGATVNSWDVEHGASQMIDLTGLLMATLVDIGTGDITLDADTNISFGGVT